MLQPWYFYWYGFQARLSAIWHWVRGHDLRWNDGPIAEWRAVGLLMWRCEGDIACYDCPDSAGGSLAIWCRGRKHA